MGKNKKVAAAAASPGGQESVANNQSIVKKEDHQNKENQNQPSTDDAQSILNRCASQLQQQQPHEQTLDPRPSHYHLIQTSETVVSPLLPSAAKVQRFSDQQPPPPGFKKRRAHNVDSHQLRPPPGFEQNIVHNVGSDQLPPPPGFEKHRVHNVGSDMLPPLPWFEQHRAQNVGSDQLPPPPGFEQHLAHNVGSDKPLRPPPPGFKQHGANVRSADGGSSDQALPRGPSPVNHDIRGYQHPRVPDIYTYPTSPLPQLPPFDFSSMREVDIPVQLSPNLQSMGEVEVPIDLPQNLRPMEVGDIIQLWEMINGVRIQLLDCQKRIYILELKVTQLQPSTEELPGAQVTSNPPSSPGQPS